jgi:aspartyl-tRNA(Asn)/glutamyl-tRNA(Gln) amidotransferase subunit B
VKEDSHDYRYFPDPDIPKFRLSKVAEFAESVLKESMPELPWQVRERYVAEGLKLVDAEVLVRNRDYAELYDGEVKTVGDEKTRQVVGNLLLTNVRSVNPPAVKLQNLRGALSKTAGMYVAGQLSSNSATILVLELLENGGDPMNLAQTRNLIQVNDSSAIKKIVEQVVAENPGVVAEVKGGKEAALKFLVGQGMKVSKGSVNPAEFEKALKSALGI